MDLLIVSDLHIESADDRLLHSLNLLLTQKARPGDRVILAGDIFDLYVGQKECFKNQFLSFHKSLRIANDRGVRVDYIEGNHDFLLRRTFKKLDQVHVHAKEVSFELQGKRFFVSHGDLANKNDYKYLALRSFFRSPLMKAFISLAPDAWIESIGRKSSHESRQSREHACESDLNQIRRIYRNYAAEVLMQGYDFVVMGHCHDLDNMKFKLGERVGTYYNVGYPRVHGSFIRWSSTDKQMTREPLPTHPALVKSTDWNPSRTLTY